MHKLSKFIWSPGDPWRKRWPRRELSWRTSPEGEPTTKSLSSARGVLSLLISMFPTKYLAAKTTNKACLVDGKTCLPDGYDEVVAWGSTTLQSKTVWGRYSSVDNKKIYMFVHYKHYLFVNMSQKIRIFYQKTVKKDFSDLTWKIFLYIFCKSSLMFRHSSGIVCFLQFRCMWPILLNCAI